MQTPISSRLPKCASIMILYLRMLCEHLNLNDTFDATVYATATISFWSQCRLSKTCVDSSFNPSTHAAHSTPQKHGITCSNITYHSFWASFTKTKPQGKFIMCTDSGCPTSMEWAFKTI